MFHHTDPYFLDFDMGLISLNVQFPDGSSGTEKEPYWEKWEVLCEKDMTSVLELSPERFCKAVVLRSRNLFLLRLQISSVLSFYTYYVVPALGRHELCSDRFF